MPARWLVKTEPSTYSFADLLRDGRTTWDGVSNALALIHLRTMAKGDTVLVYHSGAESREVFRPRSRQRVLPRQPGLSAAPGVEVQLRLKMQSPPFPVRARGVRS